MVFGKVASVEVLVPDKSVHKVAFRSSGRRESCYGSGEGGCHGGPDGGTRGISLLSVLVSVGEVGVKVVLLKGYV